MYAKLFLQLVSCWLAIYFTQQFWAYLQSPLRRIPGPFLAKFTNLWRLLDAFGGRTELTQQLLHEKYGSVVRIGPSLVSLSDPSFLRTIYDSRGAFQKTEFYAVNDTKVGKTVVKNVFSTRSNLDHNNKRSLLNPIYKMQHVLKTEGLIDDTIRAFCTHLDENFCNPPNDTKICKMDEWLLFFAWDVIGQLTFSRPIGFMKEGRDHTGYLAISEKALDYFAVIGQMPQLDNWLAKNPIFPIGPPSFDVAAAYSAQQYMARVQDENHATSGQKDMLDDLIELKTTKPEHMNDQGVVGGILVNVLAGSDTTGILLRAIVYYVLKNPLVYKKLQSELDAAGLISPVSYATASKTPYLEAVILEAGRIHPGVGMLLERIVPETGLNLGDGTMLPPGISVGMNSWVIHRNKSIYGQDAASFRPERWLRNPEEESEEEFKARLANMKKHDLTFGAGKRVCLGKEIAILETYKVVATLFATYKMEFVDPEKEWHIQNSWFVRQSGIDIKLQRRI